MSKSKSEPADIFARLEALERVCGIDPLDPEPETMLTIPVLASWVADLTRLVQTLEARVPRAPITPDRTQSQKDWHPRERKGSKDVEIP